MAQPRDPVSSESAGPDADDDATYTPTRTQVNRGRMQGLGVGQKDLDDQRDPTRARSAEQYGGEPDGGGSRGQG